MARFLESENPPLEVAGQACGVTAHLSHPVQLFSIHSCSLARPPIAS
jgi:hypothetical protein